jgi:hypothetical protein
MASAQAFMTYWMLRLLVKPQIARRWGSQSLDDGAQPDRLCGAPDEGRPTRGMKQRGY